MGLQSSMAYSKPNDECLPFCAASCMWYERNEEDSTCLNRHEFVCHKHVKEVFRKPDFGGRESAIVFDRLDSK